MFRFDKNTSFGLLLIKTFQNMSVIIPNSFSNPIVFVISDNNLPISKIDTKVSIYYADIDQSSPVTLSNLYDKLTNLSGKMHVRGDATAAMPKQQYTIKLDSHPSNGNFLGMKKGGKHWVFNDCGAVDYTLLRNTFAFTQQRSLGQYAPAYKFFELFILPPNSNLKEIITSTTGLASYYHGLYLNFDKIRFQKSRINLPYKKKKKDMTSDYAIIQLNQSSGKYLQLTPNPPLTANVEIYEPKLKDISTNIQTEFNNWFYNNSNTAWAGYFANAYSNYIVPNKPIPTSLFSDIKTVTDYTSFATYFVLNEIAKDPDGYHKSTFMVKNKSVCYAGPLWDKNKSYGNTASCIGYSQGYVKPNGWLFSITGQSPVWWIVLLKDPVFCKEIWKVWNSVVFNIIISGTNLPDWISTFIDTSVSYIKNTGALARDSQKWPNAYNSSTANYDSQVTNFKNYLSQRLAWINDNLSDELKAQSGFVPST